MSKNIPSLIAAWLDTEQTAETPLDYKGLQDREASLLSLERDVKFATDELSRRRHSRPPSFCIDFDVMFEASQLRALGGQLPFWSALLFYLDATKQVVLPGTLFETLNFFNKNSEDRIGDLGSKFIEIFQSFKPSDQAFGTTLDKAARYIFALLQKKCEVMKSSDLGAFNENTFDTAVQILAHTNRRDKVDSNRVDALNFSIISQLFTQSQADSPEMVLVSNSMALRNLQRSTIDPRHKIRSRAHHVVWNARAASIFQCLCAVTDSLLHANDLAWDLYQEVVDERRATQYMMDRLKGSDEVIVPVRKNYQSDISALLFGVEIHNASNIPDADLMHISPDLETDKDIEAAHEALNKDVELYLKEIVAEKNLSNYDLIVKNNNNKSSISEFPVDDKFTCRKHFKVSSDQVATQDSILLYSDRAQIVIEGNISPLRFVAALDRVRSELRRKLINNSLNVTSPDDDLCKVVMFAKGILIETDEVDLKWSMLVPNNNEDHDDDLNSDAHAIIDRFRKMFLDRTDMMPSLFRITTDYFDASYEGDVVVFSTRNILLREEFEIFFNALSDHNVENLGERVYVISKKFVELESNFK